MSDARVRGSEGDDGADDVPARVSPVLHPWLADTAADMLGRRARWPHALLIAGPPGVGKLDLARFFAAALLCERPGPEGFACQACDSCRYLAAGHHPDLRVIEPVDVDDDDGTRKPVEVISIKHVITLIRWSQVTSHRRVGKVAIVVPAERMNASAANALLKTLEEPPPDTFVMLVAHQPGRLPPTIASRCVRLTIPRPPAAEAVAWLKALGLPQAPVLVAQAHGAPLRALELAAPGYQAERSAWLTALGTPRSLSPLALSARIDVAPRDERRLRLAAVIDWLLAWTADIATVAAGQPPILNVDFTDRIGALAHSVARLRLFRYHRTLLRQRELLSHPLQPRLVAEALLIDYRALFE